MMASTTTTTTTHTAINELDDVRVSQIKPLIPPQILMEDLPLTAKARTTVHDARAAAANIIRGQDDRLIVVVGPCSIHDPVAARAYAGRLVALKRELAGELLIIMRVYFEKPRTTVGWKGLVNDPFLDNSFQINKGLRIGRHLLKDINEMGLPTGCELLDTISPQYIADFVSWGAIGARTTESQIHRELASGISAPIGFKNGTNGDIRIAMDAILSASASHHFLGVTKQGLSAIVHTKGNDACHVILRGSNKGPNYGREHVEKVVQDLHAAQQSSAAVHPRIMIDCSHGNSQKRHENQPIVARDIAEQIGKGNNKAIVGVMIESNLVEGKQNLVSPDYITTHDAPSSTDATAMLATLTYGQSITDACISWEQTVTVLRDLAEAVKLRRQQATGKGEEQK